MAFVGEMVVGDFFFCAIESPNALKIGKFERRNSTRPVSSITHTSQRARRKKGSILGIACTAATKSRRHSALAGATAIEMRAERNNGTSRRETIIEQGELNASRAASAPAIDGHTRKIDILTPSHPLRNQQAIDELQRLSNGQGMRFASHLHFRFAPTEQIPIHTDGTHPRQRSHTPLLIIIVASISKMPIRANDEWMPSFSICRSPGGRSIDRSAAIESGQGFEVEILHGVAIHFPRLPHQHGARRHTLSKQAIDAQTLTKFLFEQLTTEIE